MPLKNLFRLPPKPALKLEDGVPAAKTWTIEALLLASAAWWVLVCNLPFFAAAMVNRPLDEAASWGFAAALCLGLIALHALLLAPWMTRHTTKPLLALMLLAAGVSAHYMAHFGVYMDPSMLRNALRTDAHEARELFGWAMLLQLLLFAGVPLLLLWRVRLRRSAWPRALLRRVLFMAAMAALVVGLALAIFNPLASLMRNQKDMRYLINPAAPVWSLVQALAGEQRDRSQPLRAIGSDAQPGPRMAARSAGQAKPLLLVFVVGETARAANWGLNGYERQTTPALDALARRPGLAAEASPAAAAGLAVTSNAAAQPGPNAAAAASAATLINFSHVVACGTNTEVSLPCMFAPVGRRDYEEKNIRGSETLLHVLARAGVGVSWRDNQSGCKGVCDGLPIQTVIQLQPQGLCEGGRCMDEGLLHGLPQMVAGARGTQLLVLHMLGSHGPSYFRRYPPAFARFTPECRSDDLRRCSTEEIRNAYDNSLLYTDHLLARVVAQLQEQADKVDSAMLYVSDHGESLGEKGLYLHGLPYAIAPDVQKRVPMVLWTSGGFAQATGIDTRCLAQRKDLPLAHDHLFHTLLSMLDVRTALHEAAWDMSEACRSAPTAAAAPAPAPAATKP